jgi:RimJ/RimL family protein N-acetyltransferase
MTGERPTIQQLSRVYGRNIVLANVQVEDAEFILSLRLDPDRSRFLTPVDPDIEKQREWIRSYLASKGQAYFVICDTSMRRLGTVRIHDAGGDSFSWGSWILSDGAPATAALESAVLVYHLATRIWGFRSAHFKVHRANVPVLAFHEKFGARRVSETGEEVHLRIAPEQIERSLKRYARYLPAQLVIE